MAESEMGGQEPVPMSIAESRSFVQCGRPVTIERATHMLFAAEATDGFNLKVLAWAGKYTKEKPDADGEIREIEVPDGHVLIVIEGEGDMKYFHDTLDVLMTDTKDRRTAWEQAQESPAETATDV